MKIISGITSVESSADFQKELLEKFVQQNLPDYTLKQNKLTGMGGISQQYKEFECCAAETPVDGTIKIFLKIKHPFTLGKINIPVRTRFFVFCTRNENEKFKVTCSISLS